MDGRHAMSTAYRKRRRKGLADRAKKASRPERQKNSGGGGGDGDGDGSETRRKQLAYGHEEAAGGERKIELRTEPAENKSDNDDGGDDEKDDEKEEAQIPEIRQHPAFNVFSLWSARVFDPARHAAGMQRLLISRFADAGDILPRVLLELVSGYIGADVLFEYPTHGSSVDYGTACAGKPLAEVLGQASPRAVLVGDRHPNGIIVAPTRGSRYYRSDSAGSWACLSNVLGGGRVAWEVAIWGQSSIDFRVGVQPAHLTCTRMDAGQAWYVDLWSGNKRPPGNRDPDDIRDTEVMCRARLPYSERLLHRSDDPSRPGSGLYEAHLGFVLDSAAGTLELFGNGLAGASLGVAFADIRGPVRALVCGAIRHTGFNVIFIS